MKHALTHYVLLLQFYELGATDFIFPDNQQGLSEDNQSIIKINQINQYIQTQNQINQYENQYENQSIKINQNEEH